MQRPYLRSLIVAAGANFVTFPGIFHHSCTFYFFVDMIVSIDHSPNLYFLWSVWICTDLRLALKNCHFDVIRTLMPQYGPNLNKYPGVQRCILVRVLQLFQLTDEQTFWAGLKQFHWDFWSGFTIVYGEKYAFLSLFTKPLRTDQRTDGPTDGRSDIASYRDARTHLKMS